MRIISGQYKGRKLNGFDIDGTRPTKDRVKESLFGMIQNYVQGAVVLDLFAGSGSLGLECLSNGSSEAYLVDNSDIAIKTIISNSQNINNVSVIKKDFQDYLINCQKNFDIIFLDPPYHLCLINKALELIKQYNLLKVNGIIVCEYEEEKIVSDLKAIKEKRYGTTNILILKKEGK